MRSAPHLALAAALFLAAYQAAGEPVPSGTLRAAFFELADRRSGGATGLEELLAPHFELLPLPLDRPADLLAVDLVALGSFSTDDPRWGRYVRKYGESLTRHVERGGVLLQLAQAPDPRPASFLPSGLVARRGPLSFRHLGADRLGSPLLDGLTTPGPRGPELPLPSRRGFASWGAFEEAPGYRVLLWSDTQIPFAYPALVEARHGSGRLLLSSLYLDKTTLPDGSPAEPPIFLQAARIFAGNLARYTLAVREGTAPEPRPSRAEPPPPLPRVPGSATIAVLPDTQSYLPTDPQILEAQTEWIARHRADRGIAFVVHLGDVVGRDDPVQWRLAQRALAHLGDLPLAVVPGNHDYRPGSRLEDRSSGIEGVLDALEGTTTTTLAATFAPGRLSNTAHLFNAGGRSWLLVALELLPRDEVVEWAEGILADNPGRTAILVTHAYLDENGDHIEISARHKPPGVCDGADLWQRLVARHSNVALVLSGHVTGPGAGFSTRSRGDGSVVHELMSNYQMRPSGGEGYLRLLEILPDGVTLQVRTHSPWLDRDMTWPDHKLTLTLPPSRLSGPG